MSHIYTRITFRDGVEVFRETKSMDGRELYMATSHVGRTAFLELLNRWNRNVLIKDGPRHVYIAEEE